MNDGGTASAIRVDLGFGTVFRYAVSDFYFNSWRFVPANLVWGVGFVAVLLAATASPLALLLVALLAVPLAGITRIAALVTRGESAGFSDFVAATRTYCRDALIVGVSGTVLGLVLATNAVVGFAVGEPIGWFLGTSALYGLAGLAMYLICFWPVLVDPRHEGISLRRRLTLVALVVIGRPRRMFGLTVVVAVTLVLSTVLFAAIVMVSVAYTSLVTARVVLPLVDEVEARLPEGRVPG